MSADLRDTVRAGDNISLARHFIAARSGSNARVSIKADEAYLLGEHSAAVAMTVSHVDAKVHAPLDVAACRLLRCQRKLAEHGIEPFRERAVVV